MVSACDHLIDECARDNRSTSRRRPHHSAYTSSSERLLTSRQALSPVISVSGCRADAEMNPLRSRLATNVRTVRVHARPACPLWKRREPAGISAMSPPHRTHPIEPTPPLPPHHPLRPSTPLPSGGFVSPCTGGRIPRRSRPDGQAGCPSWTRFVRGSGGGYPGTRWHGAPATSCKGVLHRIRTCLIPPQ